MPAKPVDPKVWLIAGGVLLVLCGLIYFLFLRTSQVVGTVTATEWSTSVVVEAYGPVQLEDWLEAVPANAQNVSCSEEVTAVQSERPSSGRYEEVCGTEYTVDTGGGFAEVVQDCEYRVYGDYCSYTVDAWAPIDTVELEGFGLQAELPAISLSINERLGEQQATYTCVFEADGRTYRYNTDSYQQYQHCVPGSRWSLEINSLGAVVSISPAN